jgi:hypothetical protein
MLTVELLREVLRNLASWRSINQSDGIDIITCPDGQELHIMDIEFVYRLTQQVLPIRQKQAIRLCLLNGLTEEEAAAIMKIDTQNPVAMYATSGLETVIHMINIEIAPSHAQQLAYEARSSRGVAGFISSRLVNLYPDVIYNYDETG